MHAADKTGNTALHLAAVRGKLECARLLVGAGADATKRNEDGETALELAQQRGKAEIVALLEDAASGVMTAAEMERMKEDAAKIQSFWSTVDPDGSGKLRNHGGGYSHNS